MATELFTDGLEPPFPDATIWRFMERWKFDDLIATSELYFRRADLFRDENEGLPPEEYLPILGLNPFDVHDRKVLDHQLGYLAQARETFYVNCWYLYDAENAQVKMWNEYPADAVAIVSSYARLKCALDSCPEHPHLGLVRYGSKHLTGWNVQRFITTKRERFSHEREVRAALWAIDAFESTARHFDRDGVPHSRPLTKPNIPECRRCKVDLCSLVTHIVVSPWAAESAAGDIHHLVRARGLSMPVRQSELVRFRHLIPKPGEPFVE